jgi:hypothetical protein
MFQFDVDDGSVTPGNAGCAKVKQPITDGQTDGILFNGPAPIQPNARGQGHRSYPAVAAYDPSGTESPASLDYLGTVAGTWYLSAQHLGFVCVGGSTDSELTNVVPSGARYSPNIVEVQNNSGQDLPVCSAVGLLWPLVQPVTSLPRFRDQAAFVGGLPGTIVTKPPVPVPWQPNTTFGAGDTVQALIPNGVLFKTGGGTSGSTEPAWNTTLGATTTDGTITWTAIAIPNAGPGGPYDPGAVGPYMHWLSGNVPTQTLYERSADNTTWTNLGTWNGPAPGGTVAITLRPLAKGVSGPAIIAGAAQVRLVVNRLEDSSAGAILGDTYHLQTGVPGGTLIGRKDPYAVAVNNVFNNGSLKVRITATAHGLPNGAIVRIYGVSGATEANKSAWTISVIDANTFDLIGSAFTDGYAGGGVVLLTSTPITGATTVSGGTVQITSPGHKLVTGDNVVISAVTGAVALNGDWIVDVVDANTFTLRGAAWVDAYTVVATDGEDVYDEEQEQVVTGGGYTGGGLVTRVIWGEVLLSGSNGGFFPTLTDVTCDADLGLVKTYGYFQT